MSTFLSQRSIDNKSNPKSVNRVSVEYQALSRQYGRQLFRMHIGRVGLGEGKQTYKKLITMAVQYGKATAMLAQLM